MSLEHITLTVSETVTGANGHDVGHPEERRRARDEIADRLVNYVYEGLAVRGFLPISHVVERGREDDDKAIVPDELARAIRQLIASAMMAQCEFELGLDPHGPARRGKEPMPGVTMKELLAGATQNADVAQSLYVQALGIRHALKAHNVPDDVWAVIWRDAGASLPAEEPFTCGGGRQVPAPHEMTREELAEALDVAVYRYDDEAIDRGHVLALMRAAGNAIKTLADARAKELQDARLALVGADALENDYRDTVEYGDDPLDVARANGWREGMCMAAQERVNRAEVEAGVRSAPGPHLPDEIPF